MSPVISRSNVVAGAPSALPHVSPLTAAAGEGLLVAITIYNSNIPADVASVVWDAAGDNQPLTLLKAVRATGLFKVLALYWLPAPTTPKTSNLTISVTSSAVSYVSVMTRFIKYHDDTVSALVSAKSLNNFGGNSGSENLSDSVSSVAGDLVVDFLAFRDSESNLSMASGQSGYYSSIEDPYSMTASSTKPGAASVAMGWHTANYTALYDALHIMASIPAGATPPDTTAPTLTSPTGASTGTSTATGSVATNEADGTLYYLATTNATESAATVKASGATQPVATTGVKTVTASGLTPSTGYRWHFLHRDAAGNDSAVANSALFTTATPGDTTPPTLTAPTATATGSTTASGAVSTNEANGALYRYASTNPTESAVTVKAANVFSAVTATGAQTASFTGLTPSTLYYAHYLHRDASGNDSTVSNSASFTTSAAGAAGTLTTASFKNGAGAVQANLTGLTVTVLSLPGLAFVKTFASETTDGAGVNAVSDALLAVGSKYAHVCTNSAGTVIGAAILTAA